MIWERPLTENMILRRGCQDVTFTVQSCLFFLRLLKTCHFAGEISSCSNCTDFQSRRLNIRYRNANGKVDYVHTLNGTACAIPRLLIALTETHQQKKGFISLPQVLVKYMNGRESISRQKKIPELKLIKNKKS